MLLEFDKADVMTFADRKIPVTDVLNAKLKYKICVRFDGALELVANNVEGDYWIPDEKFNWNLKEKFNVLTPADYADPLDKKFSFFVGNSALLKTSKLRHFEYQYIECDYIEGVGKPAIVSNTVLEVITNSKSNDRIGYCIRRNHGNHKEDLCVQSFNPIDVHFHTDDGWYSQAVLFKKHSKNRLVLMGQQNNDIGALAIPELYFEETFNRFTDNDVIFHEKDYVKDFIKHNLAYCEEAKDFYVPQQSTYACKECMKIAQNLIEENENLV